MKHWLVGLAMLAAVGGAGCSKSAACPPVEQGVGVCVDGRPVSWSAGIKKPHMHENGGYYGPVADLAKALGVKVEIAADQKSVSIGGKQVKAMAAGAVGIHQHDAKVYAPIKEFAEAAGFRADVDGKQNTVNIHK